jgi:hypothetical protein
MLHVRFSENRTALQRTDGSTGAEPPKKARVAVDSEFYARLLKLLKVRSALLLLFYLGWGGFLNQNLFVH